METDSSRPMGPGAILGIIGGAALVIGSFLTWVTVSLDIAKFAQILGVDASALQSATSSTTFSAAGTHGDGRITLVVGAIALLAAILVIAGVAKKAGYAVVAVAGVIGAGICLIEIASKSSQIDDALSNANAGPALAQAGISADSLKSVFNVSWGIGLWICLAGGAVALIGGVIGLMSKSAPATQAVPVGGATAMGGPIDTGFGASTPPPPAAPVAPTASPATDVTPPTTPPTMPPAAPPPAQGGGGTGVDQPPG